MLLWLPMQVIQQSFHREMTVETVHFLKTHLNLIDEWLSNWRIQINLYQEISIPIPSEIKYLGIILDKTLT